MVGIFNNKVIGFNFVNLSGLGKIFKFCLL